MRVSGTILGTLTLLVGFYQAPFGHIHPDDFDHPAISSPVHWHLHHEAPASPTPAISALTADDDAIDVGWNALRSSFSQIPFALEITETGNSPELALGSLLLPIPERRGHDPPERGPTSPRAPPL